MLTVMVVDDDPLLCTAMRRKIEMIDRENQLGIQETLIAHSAQEAWGILQEKSVDILISDIRMPYQTGLELADKVNEAFPEIQVVILSGHDDCEYMRSALRSGVVDYLLKPVKLVQIQEVLLKCQENLRRRKAQSLRNGNDREVLENWLNGLLAGKPASPRWNFPIRCSGLHGLLAGKTNPISGRRKSLPRSRRRMWRHSFSQRNARRSCAVEYRKQPGGHCKSVHRNVSGVLCQAGGGTALFCSEPTVYAFGGVSCVL